MSEEEKKAIEYLKRNSIAEIEYDDYGLEHIHRIGIDEKQILLNYIDKLQNELKLKDKVIDNLYADIEYEYSGTNYLKSLEEYYKESDIE